MKKLFVSARRRLREKRLFWQILLVYLTGSMLLLSLFAFLLTRILSDRAVKDNIARSRDALGQAYAMADYVLNTTYDTYYKMYQSYDGVSIMFGSAEVTDTALAAKRQFQSMDLAGDCVDSFYFINQTQQRVYASSGVIATPEDFYDAQAMRLFQFYNEQSDTLFLPRTTQIPDENGVLQTRHYITLIFSRRNAVMVPMGGLIVNIDEAQLIERITGDLGVPDELYIVSENGSILANACADRVNTSLYGSPLWNQLSEANGQREFSFETVYNDQPCLVTGLNAPRLRFCFLSITPLSKLQQEVAYIRNLALAFAALLMLLSLAMATVASRAIYSPLSRLVMRVRRTPTQELTPPQDEITLLDSAYQTLSSEVESLSLSKQRETLVRLLYGEYSTSKKCQEEMKKHGIGAGGSYLAAVILLDDYTNAERAHPAQDMALLRYALMNMAQELLSSHTRACCAEIGTDQIAVLLTFPEEETTTPVWLPAFFQELNSAMEQHFHQTVSCGVGTPVTEPLELVTSYNRAMTAISYRLVLGSASLISYGEIAFRQAITPEYPLETDAAILQAMRNRSPDKVCEELEKFFSGYRLANVDCIQMALTQLTISVSRAVHSIAAGHEGTRSLPNYRVLCAALSARDTLEQRKELLKEYCCQAIRIRSVEVQNRKETLIENVRQFIETNYTNPMLNTDDIAAYAELSPNYLRTVFKNATGKSPADYLTDYRIEQAQELLASTNISTKEIATAVGYYNHRYFYSVFKAKTGCTATEYRKSKRKLTEQEDVNDA